MYSYNSGSHRLFTIGALIWVSWLQERKTSLTSSWERLPFHFFFNNHFTLPNPLSHKGRKIKLSLRSLPDHPLQGRTPLHSERSWVLRRPGEAGTNPRVRPYHCHSPPGEGDERSGPTRRRSRGDTQETYPLRPSSYVMVWEDFQSVESGRCRIKVDCLEVRLELWRHQKPLTDEGSQGQREAYE